MTHQTISHNTGVYFSLKFTDSLWRILWYAIWGFCYIASTSAQICQPDTLPQTTSKANFEIIDVTTVRDSVSGLLWQRCALGQRATDTSCTGVAEKKTWFEAIQAAAETDNGWRLPNIKELSSIIDYQCYAPPYNLIVFPNTPTSEVHGFWTSTPAQKNISPEETLTTVWIRDLALGHLKRSAVNNKHFIRLVKTSL